MRRLELSLLLFATAIPAGVARAIEPGPALQDTGFTGTVRPLLGQYCVECHGGDEPEADLDLERYATVADAAKDSLHWGVIIERLESGEMPPREWMTNCWIDIPTDRWNSRCRCRSETPTWPATSASSRHSPRFARMKSTARQANAIGPIPSAGGAAIGGTIVLTRDGRTA